jgi:hypothetical protein
MAVKHSKLELLVANVATKLQSPPEARHEPDCADVSRWQGEINWDAYFAHPYQPKGVITRCTLGIGGVDSQWQRNAREVLARQRPRSDYLVLFPDYSGRDQAKHYLDVSAANPPQGPAIPDFELYRYGNGNIATPARLIRVLEDAVDELLRYYKVWTYSAAWFLNSYVLTGGVPLSFREMDWHLAQYLTARYEHPGPVTLPKGFTPDMVVCHQTSDRMYGKDFGMQSEEMDYNRILQPEAAAWLVGAPAPEPQPPAPQPLTVEQRLERIERHLGLV